MRNGQIIIQKARTVGAKTRDFAVHTKTCAKAKVHAASTRALQTARKARENVRVVRVKTSEKIQFLALFLFFVVISTGAQVMPLLETLPVVFS